MNQETVTKLYLIGTLGCILGAGLSVIFQMGLPEITPYPSFMFILVAFVCVMFASVSKVYEGEGF